MGEDRLISAEECRDLMYVMCAGQDKAFQMAMEQVIDDCPTIDAKPVRHGHWVRSAAPTWEGYHWSCSECGGHIVTRYPEYPNDAWCKHCGANMDEGAEL